MGGGENPGIKKKVREMTTQRRRVRRGNAEEEKRGDRPKTQAQTPCLGQPAEEKKYKSAKVKECKSACRPGESAGHSSLPFLSVAGAALEAEAIRQIVDSGGNVFEGFLVNLGSAAKGIGDVPIFDFAGAIEDWIAALAAEIDDEVGGFPNVARDGFGGKGFGGVAVGLEDVKGGGRDVA